jgi:uncharacterized protein DUF3732
VVRARSGADNDSGYVGCAPVTLQLRKILVYGHNGKRREVPFRLGALNIVTGGPKTGKSALLDIVEYVWGRDDYTIPVGPVQSTAAWYGLLLDRDGEGIFIARRNITVGHQQGSDEFFFARSVSDAPMRAADLRKNTTGSALRIALGELLGISQNELRPPAGATRAPTTASAGNALFYCVQNQNDIDNKWTLFHRQSEPYLPQQIKDTLPYFLGAIDERTLGLQLRLDEARRQHKRMSRELQSARETDDEALTRAHVLLEEARRLHLLPEGGAAAGDQAGVLELLERVRRRGEEADALTFLDPDLDLVVLQDDRRQLRDAARLVEEQLLELSRLESEAAAFGREAGEQKARLSSLALVRGKAEHDLGTCPVCSSRLETPTPELSELADALAQMGTQLEAVRREQPQIETQKNELRKEREQLEEALRGNHRRLQERVRESARLQSQKELFLEQARVLGRIEFYLETSKSIGGDGGLPERLEKLSSEIAELERQLDPESVQERVTSALNLVSDYMTEIARDLKCEHADQRIRLDLRKLTIIADTLNGPVPLTQIGSGENWVGYHVAAHLGLHRFLRARRRPVPAFLILDQPSQAHYPDEAEGGSDEQSPDEDREAIQNLFETLWKFNGAIVEEAGAGFQIIVIDHVGLKHQWFADAVVRRWRGGEKLIPADWIDGSP